MTAVTEKTPTPGVNRTQIVDADVHERAALEELVPYLEPQWRRYITEYGWQPERLLPYAQPTAGGLDGADAKLPDGRPGGSDLGLVREQLLDLYDIDVAILTGWLNATALGAGWSELKTGLMSAYNDWQIEMWLERDSPSRRLCPRQRPRPRRRRAGDRAPGRSPPDRAGDALHRRPAVRRPLLRAPVRGGGATRPGRGHPPQ